jgi:hypothetical protein
LSNEPNINTTNKATILTPTPAINDNFKVIKLRHVNLLSNNKWDTTFSSIRRRILFITKDSLRINAPSRNAC